MRIFFDTNVLASALAYPNGLCAELLAAALKQHEVEVSEYVIEELERTLLVKLHRGQAEVNEWIVGLREVLRILPEVTPIQIELRDPNDLPIISSAVYFKSDVLVTGDKDLLDLRNPLVRIMRPRELYDLMS